MTELHTEQSPFPTSERILALYDQIETTALDTIKLGNVIGNPLLAEGYRDPRYAISVDAPNRATIPARLVPCRSE